MVVPSTATSAMMKSLEGSRWGISVARSTSTNGGWAKIAVIA